MSTIKHVTPLERILGKGIKPGQLVVVHGCRREVRHLSVPRGYFTQEITSEMVTERINRQLAEDILSSSGEVGTNDTSEE